MAAAERRLERIVRGFSNHRRIEILRLLRRRPGLSLDEIAETCRINGRTAGEHVRRLAIAGLVSKRNEGRYVRHTPTRRGNRVLDFLASLD